MTRIELARWLHEFSSSLPPEHQKIMAQICDILATEQPAPSANPPKRRR